jgi:putative transposase
MESSQKNEVISKNRRKYYLKIHLILVVKYRKHLLEGVLDTYIIKQIKNISDKYEFIIEEINTDSNHIHILISFSPNIKISSIVMRLKQISTYNIWKKYETILKYHFYKERTFWSDGYYVSTVGYIDINKVINYIKNQ